MLDSKSPMKEKIQKLYEHFLNGNHFILTTHTSCDPDGIGAELGLAFLLEKLGKIYTILNPDKTPERYQFLDAQEKINFFKPEKFININSNSTVVIVDNSELKRILDINQYINQEKSNLIVIDHHDGISDFPGLFCFPEVGSTSELIYELIELSGFEPDFNTSLALYAGIIMDTGQFKYRKTRPRTHEIASKLLVHKLPTEEIIRKLFEHSSHLVLLLKKDIYSTLEVFPQHHLATIEITKEMLNRYNFKSNPAEGITSDLLSAGDVFISAAFIETENGMVKMSLRSKGSFDVRMIAEQYSGGGHTNACGATIKGNLKQIKSEVSEKLKELVSQSK